MVASREYVLQRLDKQYINKIKENFNPKLEQELNKRVTEKLIEKRDFSTLVIFNIIFPQFFSRKAQLNKAGTYFSEGYASLEALIEGSKIEGETIDNIPEGVRNEYIEPLIKVSEKIGDFVNKVRQKSDEITPRELTDKEINDAAIEVYGNINGLAKMYSAIGDVSLQLMDIAYINQQIPKIIRKNMVKIWDVWKDEMPYLLEHLFPDIPK